MTLTASDIIAACGIAVTAGLSLYIFLKSREERRRDKEETTIKDYITDLDTKLVEKIDKVEDHTGEKISKVEGASATTNLTVNTLEKRVRVLESQLVVKSVVKEMLDDRVRPLEVSVSKLEDAVEQGFSTSETDMKNVISVLSRLEGKLEGSGVIKGN